MLSFTRNKKRSDYQSAFRPVVLVRTQAKRNSSHPIRNTMRIHQEVVCLLLILNSIVKNLFKYSIQNTSYNTSLHSLKKGTLRCVSSNVYLGIGRRSAKMTNLDCLPLYFTLPAQLSLISSPLG